MEPDLIICDEPVSALDVSVQAQILNLLDDLKERYDLTLVFIAHDLAVVKHVSTRVAVMYLGKICEVGDPDALYARPAHPYTAALLASIPVPDPDVRPDDADLLSGDLPSPVDPPSRVPLPHPLPPGAAAVRGRGARDPPGRPRPVRGLPLPPDRLEACARSRRPGRADAQMRSARSGQMPRSAPSTTARASSGPVISTRAADRRPFRNSISSCGPPSTRALGPVPLAGTSPKPGAAQRHAGRP